MKKVLLFSLLFVLLAPQTMAAQGLSMKAENSIPDYLYEYRDSLDTSKTIETIAVSNQWQEDGFSVKNFETSSFEFAMINEYQWPYGDDLQDYKNFGQLPLIAWKDQKPYVAVLNLYASEVRVYNYQYPQHANYTWTIQGSPYIALYDHGIIVQGIEDETDWFSIDVKRDNVAKIFDFEDTDVGYTTTSYGFPFKPVVLTNGSLFFWDKKIANQDREVIWVYPYSFEISYDSSAINTDLIPEPQYFMLDFSTSQLALSISDYGENPDIAVGTIGSGIYSYNIDKEIYTRVGYGSSNHYDSTPRALKNGDLRQVAWINQLDDLFYAEYSAYSPPGNGISDIPSFKSFRTEGSNIVYKNDGYRVNGVYRSELIKFCSARVYELATQDYAFDYLTVIPDSVDFDRNAPCGGLPYFRPFKLASSPTVYYEGNQGLVSYCSADDYIEEHNDPDFYWVVEFADGELEFEKPKDCKFFLYDE
ncbi:MAG: hypothetical protein ABH846_02170 [Patescibacteria group bacterium]